MSNFAFRDAHLKQGEYANTTWRIIDAPPELAVDDLLRPESWAHIAYKLRQHDEIIIVPQGAPYRAHLIVLDAGKNSARVRLLDVTLLNATTADAAVPEVAPLPDPLPDDAPLLVKYESPATRYCVFRKSDKAKLSGGHAEKAEALAWARDHMAAMAA